VLDEKLLSILVCPKTAGHCCWSTTSSCTTALRRAYRIEDGIPVLLVDEAVAVTDDTEHQRMLAGRSPRQVSPGSSPVR